MLIVTARQLNPVQIVEAESIVKACQAAEPLQISYPYREEDTLHIIGYEENIPVAIIGMCRMEEDAYEAVGFTIPQYRRQGKMRELMARASRLVHALHYKRSVTVSWICDEYSSIGGKAAVSMGADLVSIENEMSLDMDENFVRKHLTHLPEGEFLIRRMSPTGLYYRVYQGSEYLAGFSLLFYSDSKSVCLYSFEVDSDLRGHGIGRRIFPHILRYIHDHGINRVLLQVSEQNRPAMRIYRGIGMKITKCLGYYAMKW